jgi:hypothetical protein
MACIITYNNKKYTQKEFEQYFKEHFTEFVGEFLNTRPDVILPIGTSGSGKSTFIKSLPQKNLVVIEPDAMRVEFTGNINDKSKDKEIYIEAANRAVAVLKANNPIDVENLSPEERLRYYKILDMKKSDGGEITLKDINENPTLYQITQNREIEEFVASEKTIRDLAARMSDRIGIPVRFESDRSKEYKGKLENGTAVVNLAYATLDTPIHEILGHPIIRAIKSGKKGIEYTVYDFETEQIAKKAGATFNRITEDGEAIWSLPNNSQLYQNLLKELEYGKGKEVLDRVKRDYVYKENTNRVGKVNPKSDYYFVFDKNNTIISEQFNTIEEANKELSKYDNIKYTLEEQQEEAIVELLGLMTAEKLNAVKDGKLISLLKRLLKEIKAFMKDILFQKEVEIDKLPDNMTINDLSDLLAYSNSKLILPGYEVEYTTPDNEKFKTYQEASNHISDLAKSVEDVDLDSINITQQPINIENIPNEFSGTEGEGIPFYVLKLNNKWFVNYDRQLAIDEGVEISEEKAKDYFRKKQKLGLIKDFIEKNKEYEQSKEIIEEWKKVNNIQYNPEEIYSRGQEFSSVVGAYSNFDVNLMMQNLLQHIEDNEKAGGQFAISAYTKPIDRQIGHLEGGGGKIKFKLYPQSNDILWAANTDVYSGSVWDASEKVNKDKKSELLGVSYTKYPSLRNVDAVQPNLASIVDDLSHHHNELAISLNFNNFEIEIDEDVPYQTKKIIDSINKILEQKRNGKLVKPEIKTNKFNKGFLNNIIKRGYVKADEKQNLKENYNVDILDSENSFKHIEKIKNVLNKDNVAIQPTQTASTLKESIDGVKDKVTFFQRDISEIPNKFEGYSVRKETGEKLYQGTVENINGVWKINNQTISEEQVKKLYFQEKEYTSQALINTKIAALKEVAKKYPRSLIRSEVKSIKASAFAGSEMYNAGFNPDELPFQKLSKSPKEILQEKLNEQVKNNKRVVLDTTNLTKDKRLPFIEAIKKAIPTANIQYKLMELNPELAKQRIKAQLARGENRANVSDETIDRHATSYKQMLEDVKNEPITKYKELGSKQDIEGFKKHVINQIPAYEFKPNAGDALAYEEDYDSIATVPKVSKERGDDAQVIARFKSLINRLKLLKNNPSLNKFKIQEKIDLYQSEIDKYKQADTTDEKIEILQLLAEESLTDSEEAMDKDNLSPAQLRNILSSAEMWKDFRQFVEVDNVSAEIGLLENRANALKLAVYNRIVDYMKEQSSKTKYNLSSDDIKQLDEDGLLLNILDIKQSRNKMIRYIGYQIERMGIEKELEVKRKVDESNKLFEKLSNLDFDKLFKKDAKGRTMRNHFIYEVNDEFYDARKKVGEQVKLFFDPATKEQLTKLVLQAVSGGRADAFKDAKDLMYLSSKLNKEYIDATIDAAREAALDPALNESEIVYYAFNKGIKKAKEARTTWYKENTITLNPAAFMSGTTPEERQRIIDEFKAAVGNDHYAESRVKTGENRVNRYYKDQNEWRLYLEEKHIGDDEAFKAAMDEWEYANNPFWYYDSIHNEANIDPEIADLISKTRDFDKLPAYAPSKPEHYDNQFKEVLANENLLNLYNFMTEYMKEAVRLFPPDASKEVGVDFFVKMQATAWESFMNNGISGLKTNTAIVDAVAVQHNFEHINQVDELGNPLKQISYERFLDVDKERLNLEALLEDPTISPQDRNIYQKRIKEIETSYTLDLKKTMQLLITQVESFRFSNEIADAAELQLYMVNQAKESTNSGYKNVGLSTTKKVTNYAVEAGVYNMYRADPDQANKNDFWGDNVFENKDVFGLTSDKKKKAREIKEKAMAIEPMYRGYIEKLDRGEELSDAADPTERAEEIQQAWDVINSYNNYKKEYKDLGGKRSSFSKFIDWGIEVTQLKTMGLSFVSPITNLNFGVLSNYKEALVGQFLNVKECSAALKEMLSTTNNFLTWGKGGKNKKREKIVNFLEKNNLIFDIMEANYGKGQRVSYDKMFMWMRSSDFFMKGQLIIGSLMHDQIETINGPKSLWSLVKEDGTIDETQVPEWNKDKQIDMIQKLLALSRRVHGNTDTKSAKFSNKFALGRALGQFKASWMSEGLNSAYNHSREDEILGTRLEGRIRALPRLYREMKALKDNSGAGTWIGKWSDAMSNIKNMEEGDIYNIRRLAIDGVMIISLYMLYISLKMLYNSMTDDDKYKKMALGGTMNLLYRLRNDVQFYTSVGTFKEITSNPIPSLRIITDFQKAIYQTADIMNPMNDTDADDIERTMKNWAKTAPVTRQIVTNSNMVNDLYEDYQY